LSLSGGTYDFSNFAIAGPRLQKASGFSKVYQARLAHPSFASIFYESTMGISYILRGAGPQTGRQNGRPGF